LGVPSGDCGCSEQEKVFYTAARTREEKKREEIQIISPAREVKTIKRRGKRERVNDVSVTPCHALLSC
jgi:hypothetical protein